MYRVLCEVADSKGHMILGRKQALVMEYVSFPEIQKPAVQAKTDRPIKTLVEEPAETTNGPAIARVQKCTDPVVPVIQKCTQEKITINGKTHSLPTTKDYLLQEYADVFQGIGTLPGGPYRIQLKGYKPIQHPPRHVAVSLKPPYKAELERLTQLGVIKEGSTLSGLTPLSQLRNQMDPYGYVLTQKILTKLLREINGAAEQLMTSHRN